MDIGKTGAGGEDGHQRCPPLRYYSVKFNMMLNFTEYAPEWTRRSMQDMIVDAVIVHRGTCCYENENEYDRDNHTPHNEVYEDPMILVPT